jgi:hypothetical protein
MILFANSTPPNLTSVTTNSPNTSPLSVGQTLEWNATFTDVDDIERHAFYLCSNATFNTTSFTCAATTVCANTSWTLGNNLSCYKTANISMGANNTNYAFVCDPWNCSAAQQINYSVYNDTQTPTVQLIEPSNDPYTPLPDFAVTFNYIPADDYGFANCTLYTNATGAWQAAATNTTIQNDTNNYFTATFPGDGTYTWNVQCSDFAGHTGTNSANWSLLIQGPPVVNLKTPANNTYSSNPLQNFTYNVTYSGNVTSCALLIDGAEAASDSNVTLGATASFPYTFGGDGSHTWNVHCIGFDSRTGEGDGVALAGTPRNITIDSVNPTVSLLLPGNTSVINQSTVTFIYNASDDTAIANCTLVVDGADIETRSTIANGANQSVSYIIENGAHTWHVTCRDNAANPVTSPDWTVTVNASTAGGFTFYESNQLPGDTTQFAPTANLNLSTSLDGTENNVYLSQSGTSPSKYVSAISATFQSNGILILPNASINFSAVFGAQTNNSGYITWKFFKQSGASDAEICRYGTVDISGRVINNTVKSVYTASCTNSSAVRLLGNESVKLEVWIYNSNNLRRWYRHYVDNESTLVLFNFTRLGFLAANLTQPVIDLVVGVNDTINATCMYTCNGGTCLNAQVSVQRNSSGGAWQDIPAAGGVLILNGSETNPHSVGDVKSPGNSTSFILKANATGTAKLRCWATSNYSNLTVWSAVNITVQATGKPTVQLLSPANDTYSPAYNQSFVFIPSSAKAILNCSLYFNGALNQTISVTKDVANAFNVTDLAEGLYLWNVTCIDSDGRNGSSVTYRYTADRSAPAVTLNTPDDGANFTTNTITFNWTANDTVDTAPLCNLTIDSTVMAAGVPSPLPWTNRTVAGLALGVHWWNVTCVDDAGNKNTSAPRSFNITNLPPQVALVSPPNNTWTNNATVQFAYNVTEPDDPRFNASAQQQAMIVYRSATGAGEPVPRYRTWNGTAWSAEGTMTTAGSNIRFIRLAASGSSARPREKVAVTLSADAGLDAYVWNGSAWSVTNGFGTVDTGMEAYKSYDVAYETQSGRAFVVYSVSSTSGAQDLAYRIWNGTAWLAEAYIDDAFASGDILVSFLRLARNPGSNELALVFIDTTNGAARAMLWDGSAWGNETNITTSIAVPDEEDVAVAYEQQSFRLLAVAGEGSLIAYRSFTASGGWSVNATVDANPAAVQTTNWLVLKPNPAANQIMLLGVDGGSDLSTILWSNGAWSTGSATRHDAAVDTNAARVADFDWEQAGSKGLLAYGTTSGYLHYRQYSAGSWGVISNVTTVGGTHSWVVLRRNPGVASGDSRILGAVSNSSAPRPLDSINWTGTILSVTSQAFTTDISTAAYEAFDMAYENFPPDSTSHPPYVLAGCSLYLNGAYNQTNATPVLLEQTNTFTAADLAEGNHSWYVNCADTDGSSSVSPTRRILVDRTPPSINLTYPASGTNLSIFTFNFTFRATDNLAPNMTCNLTIDGAVNQTGIVAFNNTAKNVTVSGLNDSIHLWNVTCVDLAGNANTSLTSNFSTIAPPVVTLVSPANNLGVNTTGLTLIYNVTENSFLQNCSLYFDGAFNQTNQTAVVNGGQNNFTLASVAEGLHTWQVRCVDGSNYEGNSSVWNITVDRGLPWIELNYPGSGDTVRTGTVLFNWTAYDNIDTNLTCNLTQRGPEGYKYANNVASPNGTPTTSSLSGLQDGQHWWNVTCWDDANNKNISATWTFNVSKLPTLNLVSPSQGAWVNTSTAALTYYVYQTYGIANCTLTLDGAVNQTTPPPPIVNGQNNNFTVMGLAPGTHTWSVNCTDNSSGTQNTSTWNFTVDLEPPAITLNAPNDTATVPNNTVTFNYTAVDARSPSMTCNLTVNGTVYSPNAVASNNTPKTANVLLHGGNASYTWNVTCRDQALNYNISETRSFFVVAPPNVQLISPAPFAVFSMNGTFVYKPTDPFGLKNCSLLIDDTPYNSTTNVTNATNNNLSAWNIPPGTHNWTVLCYDVDGDPYSPPARQFSSDANGPSVILNAPDYAAYFPTGSVLFNWTAIDDLTQNLTCTVWVDGANRSTLPSQNATPTWTTVSPIADGLRWWNVSCTDQGFNTNWSETRNFTVNQTPIVTPVSPGPNAQVNNGTLAFQYQPSDNDGFTNCSLYLNGTLNASNQSAVVNNAVNNVTVNLPTGIYTWFVRCYDNGTYSLWNDSQPRNLTVNLLPPNITLNAPPPAYPSNFSWVLFNWTAYEIFGGNLTCNLTVNGTIKALNVPSPSGTPVPKNITALVDGFQIWNVTCHDPAGNNVTSETRNFTVNEPPAISLGNPSPGLRTTNTDLTFFYTATDNSGNLSGCTFILDGAANGTNATPVSSGVQANFTRGPIADGLHTWTVNCTDPSGNTGTSSPPKNFTVDTLPPLITLLSPGDGQTMGSNNVTLNWTANDSSPTIVSITCNVSVTDNGTLLFSPNITQANGTVFSYTFPNLTDGEHNWSAACRDDLGNANTSENRSFIINQADLYVNSSRFTLNNTNPDLGQTIQLRANVTNIGGVPATNVLVEFWDGLPGSGTLIGNATGNVAINSSTLFTVNWSVTPGYHELWVAVDPYNAVAEMNETNNNASLNFSALVSTITAPGNATLTNDSTPQIDFNVTDSTANNITYKVFVDGAFNGQTGNVTSGSNTSINLSSLADGTRQIRVQATDTLNRSKNSTTLFIIVDTHAPNGTFLTTNGTYFNTSSPTVTIRITDNIDAMLNYTIFVNGTANVTDNASNNTATNVTLTGFADGAYLLVIQSFDDAGNYANSTSLTIYVDTAPPAVTLVSPNDAANFSVRNVTLTYNVTDNLDPTLGCNLTLDGGVVQQANVSNGGTKSYNATNLGEGVHWWNVTCWDGNNAANQVNNLNTSESRSFGVYIAPNITLLSPGNNTISNNATQLFLFNVSDETGLTNCSIIINGAVSDTKTTAQLVLNSTNNFTVSGLNNTVMWAVTCTDNSSGLATSTSGTRNLTIDLVPPTVIIVTVDGTWFNTSAPVISYNATDNYATKMNITIFLDGAPNVNATANNNSVTQTTLVNMSDGSHTVVVQATDNATNAANSSAITIWVDTKAPNVTLLEPGNDTHLGDTQTVLNFTVTDNLAQTLLCNLTLDSSVIAPNLTVTNGSNSSTPVTGLAGGWHNWSAACRDNASNRGVSQTWRFYIELPDLHVDAGNITLSNSTPIENQTIEVNATVWNLGLIAAANITVQFWRGDPQGGGVQIGQNQTIATLAINGSATFSVNYTALIGLNQVYVVVDPPAGTNGSIKESNESNNVAHQDFTVGLYDIFAGGSVNDLRVANAAWIELFDWNQTNTTGSNVFVADSSSSLHFTQLRALGINATNGSSPNDFATLDTKLNATNLTDSINRTWTSGGNPVAYLNLTSFKQQISSIPVVNSTNTSAFVTGIVWDWGDGGGAYNGSQDVAFLTVMNQSQQGQYGTYDYEIRVPATLRDYIPGGGTVTFYVELR